MYFSREPQCSWISIDLICRDVDEKAVWMHGDSERMSPLDPILNILSGLENFERAVSETLFNVAKAINLFISIYITPVWGPKQPWPLFSRKSWRTKLYMLYRQHLQPAFSEHIWISRVLVKSDMHLIDIYKIKNISWSLINISSSF